MPPRRIAALAGAALLAFAAPALAADGIAVGKTVVTLADLAALPAVPVTATFSTEHGPFTGKFEGPLLWTVLEHAGAVDPAKPRDQVRLTVLITGRDGYTAVLALGEVSPEFEAKQVIVAERMDGQDLPLGHVRLVVPGDKRGGRSVRDVASIVVGAGQ